MIDLTCRELFDLSQLGNHTDTVELEKYPRSGVRAIVCGADPRYFWLRDGKRVILPEAGHDEA